jgi:hypothetical protein
LPVEFVEQEVPGVETDALAIRDRDTGVMSACFYKDGVGNFRCRHSFLLAARGPHRSMEGLDVRFVLAAISSPDTSTRDDGHVRLDAVH